MISGQAWNALVHPDEVDAYAAGYLHAVREQTTWHDRNRIRRHDGLWCTFDNHASPLFGVDGTFLGHVGVSVDVTNHPFMAGNPRSSDARRSDEDD